MGHRCVVIGVASALFPLLMIKIILNSALAQTNHRRNFMGALKRPFNSLRLGGINAIIQPDKGPDSSSTIVDDSVFIPPNRAYDLIDCGNRKRLERFGEMFVVRSCPAAVWRPKRPTSEWDSAQLVYDGTSGKAGAWSGVEKIPPDWSVQFGPSGAITFSLTASDLGQVGVFPEQGENWDWIRGTLLTSQINRGLTLSPAVSSATTVPESSAGNRSITAEAEPDSNEEAKLSSALTSVSASNSTTTSTSTSTSTPQSLRRVLNGFAYTGGSTMAALSVNSVQVTHLDASRSAVNWAIRNAKAAGLADLPVRWITDDCLSFLEREIRRGNRYHGLIFDPPAFGRGGNGKVWKLEKDLSTLLEMVSELMADDADFVLLSCHDVNWPPERLAEALTVSLSKKFKVNSSNNNNKSKLAADSRSASSIKGDNSRKPIATSSVSPPDRTGQQEPPSPQSVRLGSGWLEHAPMILRPSASAGAGIAGNALPLGGYARWVSDLARPSR